MTRTQAQWERATKYEDQDARYYVYPYGQVTTYQFVSFLLECEKQEKSHG